MAGGKFIGWIFDKVPDIFKWAKKKGRENEVNKIDNAVDSNDDKFIKSKLRSVQKKYARESKGNS